MAQSFELRTSRLTIVGISDINADLLIDYFATNTEHLKQGGGGIPETPHAVLELMGDWIERIENENDVRFFILKEAKIIGIVGVTNIVFGAFQAAYLGYNLAETEQGNGYMTEALEAIIQFSFKELSLHRLMANYRPENIASGRVLEKLDFIKEGFSEKYILVKGVWEDHILTALRNDNWQEEDI